MWISTYFYMVKKILFQRKSSFFCFSHYFSAELILGGASFFFWPKQIGGQARFRGCFFVFSNMLVCFFLTCIMMSRICVVYDTWWWRKHEARCTTQTLPLHAISFSASHIPVRPIMPQSFTPCPEALVLTKQNQRDSSHLETSTRICNVHEDTWSCWLCPTLWC